MVIINKDDYLSFMNEVGVRMQSPSVNVNNQLSTTISATTVGVGGPTTLVKQNNGGNNKAPLVARAVLVCRPNSHPFQVRYFSFFSLVLVVVVVVVVLSNIRASPISQQRIGHCIWSQM